MEIRFAGQRLGPICQPRSLQRQLAPRSSTLLCYLVFAVAVAPPQLQLVAPAPLRSGTLSLVRCTHRSSCICVCFAGAPGRAFHPSFSSPASLSPSLLVVAGECHRRFERFVCFHCVGTLLFLWLSWRPTFHAYMAVGCGRRTPNDPCQASDPTETVFTTHREMQSVVDRRRPAVLRMPRLPPSGTAGDLVGGRMEVTTTTTLWRRARKPGRVG